MTPTWPPTVRRRSARARQGTDVAFLTISTGIGAGVVNSVRLLLARRSLAEVGHTVIDWRAWHEGRPGTLEELGSRSGVARRASEAGLAAVDAREVETAARAGDHEAKAILQDAITACAAGVASLVFSFYPDTVVIGGGWAGGRNSSARCRRWSWQDSSATRTIW